MPHASGEVGDKQPNARLPRLSGCWAWGRTRIPPGTGHPFLLVRS